MLPFGGAIARNRFFRRVRDVFAFDARERSELMRATKSFGEDVLDHVAAHRQRVRDQRAHITASCFPRANFISAFKPVSNSLLCI